MVPRAVGFTIVWPGGVIFGSIMTYHVQFLLLVRQPLFDRAALPLTQTSWVLPPFSVGKMTLRLYGALNYSHGLSKGPSFGTGRDRDQTYGAYFDTRVDGLGIEQVLTAPRPPWQNPFVERMIGSIRRECLDHVIVLDERHLKRILRKYVDYYHSCRTHLSLEKDAPEPRRVESPAMGKVRAIPKVGGLHHQLHSTRCLSPIRSERLPDFSHQLTPLPLSRADAGS